MTQQIGQFIINHWELWAILILVLVFILINELIEQKKQAKEVTAQEAVKLINNDNAIIIDLRDNESYQKGHIINAIKASTDDFDNQQMNKYKDQTLIFVCSKGLESKTLVNQLRTQGFTKPMVLAGGIAAWQNADLPLVKGK